MGSVQKGGFLLPEVNAMATNWDAILSNTNNLQDVLSILKKVLASLDIKADMTTIDEALALINSLDADVQEKLSDVTDAITKFNNTGGFISAPTLEALQAITPEYDYQLARVDDTGNEYRWNPALTTTVKWEATGRNFLSEVKAYTDESIAQNLLFDPFNETVGVDKKDSMQSVFSANCDNYLAISPNSPFGKPTLQGLGTNFVRRSIDVKKLGVKSGDKVYVRMMAYSANSSIIQFGAYLRKSDSSNIDSSLSSKGGATLLEAIVGPLTITSDTHHILIFINGSADKELIASSISTSRVPKYVYGSINADYYPSNDKTIKIIQDTASKNTNDITQLQSAKLVVNLMPDPFFRSYKNGVTLIDGFPLLNEAGYSVVDYANSPFIAKNAIRSPAPTSSSLNKNVLFARLGVKVGDTITVKLGLIAIDAGAFVLGVYARKVDNTVIGSATNSSTVLVANTYTEVAHTITVTQEMMDSAYIIQIRLNVVGTTFTNGYHVLGGAIYRNNTTMNIQDTNYVEDDLRKGIAEAKSLNSGIPFTFGNYYLRETRQRTRKRLLNESARLVIASVGDSWTHNRGRWSGTVASQLMTQFGDGGGGWTGFGFANAALPNDNARTTYTVAREGSWQSHYGSSVSPDICDAYSTTAGDRINCRAPATPQVSACQLFYIGSGDGVIRYRMTAGTWSDIESVAWTTLNLNAVAVGELGISELSGIPTGQVSLQFEVVSGTCTLCGINWKSNTDGVVWHKIAGTGTNTGQWTGVNGVQWAKGLQALNPNLVTILHGTNDQNGRSATAFATNIGTLIDRIRSVLPLADILVIMPCENGRNNSIPMSSYTEAAYNICKSKKVAFMDLQKVFGESFSEYASTSERNWFNADLIHPEPNTGGRAITDAVMRFLLD